MPRVGLALMLVAAVVGSWACRNLCLTSYDACRLPYDAGTLSRFSEDAAFPVVDGGVDAGFPGCIREGCQAECANVVAPEFICVNPQCVACQLGDGGSAGAAFCGRYYPCGRDAGVTDAAVRDASVSDAAVPDAGPLDASAPDAHRLDASGLDGSTPDAAVEDAGSPDAAGLDAGAGDGSFPDAGVDGSVPEPDDAGARD